MTPEEAKKYVTGLSGCDRMAPVHRAEFHKALNVLIQAYALDFLERLDDAMYQNIGTANYEPTQQVAELIDELCAEHGVEFIRGEGFQPVQNNKEETT